MLTRSWCRILVPAVAALLRTQARADDIPQVPSRFKEVQSTWKVMPRPLPNSCTGPTDAAGLTWTSLGFDDSSWFDMAPPDNNQYASGTFGQPADQYFRGRFTPNSSSQAVYLAFAAESAVEIYINGVKIGTFSREPDPCHAHTGSINISDAADTIIVQPLQFPENLLQSGTNVVAAHVSTGKGGYLYFAMIVISPKSLIISDTRHVSLHHANILNYRS